MLENTQVVIGSSGAVVLSAKFASYLFTSALGDAVFPVFYIFLPLFATELGASPLELGLVGGAAYAVYSFMPFVMGHFSDRRGSRKFFILSSLALLAVVSVLYSVSSNAIIIVVVLIFEGTGWAMLWPAMEAAVTEDTSHDSVSSLAIFNYSWALGAAIGPGLGTFLVTTFSYRAAFQASGLLLVVPIISNGMAFFGERGNPPPKAPAERPAMRLRPSLASAARSLFFSADPARNFQVQTSFITMALSTLTSAVFFTFFGPYATSIGITIILVGGVTTTVGVVRLLVYIALGNHSLRERALKAEKRNWDLIAFTTLAALSSLLLFVRDSTGLVYFVAFGLFGFGYSMVYAISQANMIADVPADQRGTGAGLFESSIGIGGTIGPPLAGALSSSSLTTAFTVPVIGLALTLLLLYALAHRAGARSQSRNIQMPLGLSSDETWQTID